MKRKRNGNWLLIDSSNLSTRFFCLIFLPLLCTTAIRVQAQTDFDSLKRNSNLDTLYQPSNKPTFATEFTTLKISGFLQPALYYDFNSVLNNEVFVTSEIPTEKLTDIRFNRFHMSATQSRIGFSFTFPKTGKNVSAFLESDFLSSTRGTSANLRLRHAYFTFGEFLIGQSWTNFGDVNASPNTLDLEGPNSMPASRVAQIRWRRQISKQWNLLLAIEQPKTDYTPLDSAKIVESPVPKIVVKPKLSFKNGHWSNSFLLKPIVYTNKDFSTKEKLHAWGFTSSLSLNLPDRGFRPLGLKKRTVNVFGIIGSGTQGDVNDFGGLGYEAFPKDESTLETLLYYGGYLSYGFVFRKRWSSTFVYSYLYQEEPTTTSAIFKHSHYLAGNATLAVNRYLTIGTELLYGIKRNHDDSNGSAVRLLSVVRLLF